MNGFNQEPATTQNFSRWKLPAIIGGVAVLIILIIVGGWWLVKSRGQIAVPSPTVSSALQELDKSLAACDNIKNTEICRSRLTEDMAVKVGSTDVCQELKGTDFESCVWKVARTQLKADDCDLISNKDKKNECKDSIYRVLASQDLSLSWCEKISDELTRTRCINTLTEQIAKEKGCSGTGIDQSVCDHQKILGAVIASNDSDQCYTLSDIKDQSACLESVGPGDKDGDGLNSDLENSLGTSDESLDSDNDGLSDAEEHNEYKTNPSVIDTDGDGFSDGDEVKNGYNPLGAGKIQLF